MNPAAGIEVEPVVTTAARPASPRVSAGMVLLIGAWIGLVVGFIDVGLLVINKKFILRDFYRLSMDFPWIVPAAVTFLVLLPTALFALIAKIRGSLPLPMTVGLISWVGFFELGSRVRLELWATLILSLALALQSARFLRTRGDGFLRLVRWSVGLLVAILLATPIWTIGRPIWTEHRQIASLPPAPTVAQNVLLIVWDTVRASNTSLYGYKRPTTPNLEQLASRGARFDRAFSASSWTLPAHASMFTGRWPHELRVDWKAPMRDVVPTLAEHLSSHGYETAGFIANIDYCAAETGLARGFAHYEDFTLSLLETFTRYVAIGRRIDVPTVAAAIERFLEKHLGRWYDVLPRSKEHQKRADEINDAFLGWLGKRPANGRPFFAFLNYNDAHTPYEVPDLSIPGYGLRPSTATQRETLRAFTGVDKMTLSVEDVQMATDVYDDSISYMDLQLGRLVDELSRRGVLENTLLIITSDHGEHLGDHKLFFHGGSLYRELVQVPLLMVDNKRIPAGAKVADAVSLCDLPATINDLLGLGPKQPFPGQSVTRYLQPRAGDEAPRVANPLLMETTKPDLFMNGGREPAAKGPMKSVIAAGMHYIQMADGTEELYDLNNDVFETNDISKKADSIPIVAQLRNLLWLMLQRR